MLPTHTSHTSVKNMESELKVALDTTDDLPIALY